MLVKERRKKERRNECQTTEQSLGQLNMTMQQLMNIE